MDRARRCLNGERLIGECNFDKALNVIGAPFPDKSSETVQIAFANLLAIGFYQPTEINGIVFPFFAIAVR